MLHRRQGNTSFSHAGNVLLAFSQENCGVFRVGWEAHILQSVSRRGQIHPDSPRRLQRVTLLTGCWMEVWGFPGALQLPHARVTGRLDIASDLREERGCAPACLWIQCICLAVQQRHHRPGRSRAVTPFLPLKNPQGFLGLTLSCKVKLGFCQLQEEN